MDFMVSSDIISEFLEVAINLILYTREIYPSPAFQRKKKYNVPVQMCIHPGLSSYISDCVGAIKPVLDKGQINKVVVAILSEAKIPVEKFIFEINQMAKKPQEISDDKKFDQMEECLRSFCLKLSRSKSVLSPLPPKCSFAIHLQVSEQMQQEMSTAHKHQNFPWIEAEQKQVEVINSQIIPIRSFKTELCQLELYVEESSNKK